MHELVSEHDVKEKQSLRSHLKREQKKTRLKREINPKDKEKSRQEIELLKHHLVSLNGTEEIRKLHPLITGP
jgi:SMC interacting uncharacterized protein involved in chromosome segregation